MIPFSLSFGIITSSFKPGLGITPGQLFLIALCSIPLGQLTLLPVHMSFFLYSRTRLLVYMDQKVP